MYEPQGLPARTVFAVPLNHHISLKKSVLFAALLERQVRSRT